MSCPNAVVWADLVAGKLDAHKRERVETHAASCASCQAARARVERASGAMAALRQAPAPELPETLGARLHWNISSELRRRERERDGARAGSRLIPLAFGGVAALAAALAVVWYVSRDTSPQTASPAPDPAPPSVRPERSGPEGPAESKDPLDGVVTLLSGDATLDGSPLTPASAISAGARLASGKGRVHVQFGERSAFHLEPGSTLDVRAFDDRNVELAVTGAVTVELEKRHPDQRFAILAGDRRVEVRGTVFRVDNRDGALDVVVTRGRVAVLDGASAVEIPAGARLALARGAHLGSVLPAALSSDDAASFVGLMRVVTLPTWNGGPTLRASTAVVKVAARPGSRVRLDGVDIGAGPLTARATAGRHLVEAGALSRWVEVDAGETSAADVVVPNPRSERPGQVAVELSRYKNQIMRCGDRVRKVDRDFVGRIEVEIRITADGSVNAVSAVRGLDDRASEDCVLGILRDKFTFPEGTSATVRREIVF